MVLGREVMGAWSEPVVAMQRMRQVLSGNCPWDELVTRWINRRYSLMLGHRVERTDEISVTPFLVPHRDEYSETVGYRIDGPHRSMIFIPDIDKGERWGTAIETVIRDTDVALLDGTFFQDGEIPGRSMA